MLEWDFLQYDLRFHTDLGVAEMEFQVQHCIGKGTSSHVFAAANIETFEPIALKVQSPPCPWEFYIQTRIQNAVSATMVS